ncbi:uncharacterized protein [Eurosta solidaginis]|uniref:uncharacterized protein n=1 Tax=Eurosta solidaginis TaxID=178769 RepID=UPI003530DD8C
MFSSQNHTSCISSCDDDGYDFTKSNNAGRWKGLFIPSLKKVLEQVHPRLSAKEDALLFVETLCLRILAMLCAKPLPHIVQIIPKTDVMAHQKVVRETKVLIKSRITGESGDNLHTDIAEMLPMKTLDVVFDFEEKMEGKNFEDAVITYFFALKGMSGDLCGVVKQIFSDDVLDLFNWSGGNNKKALSKLKIVHIALFEIFKLLGRLTFKDDLSKCITLSHNRCKQRRYLKNKK